MARAGCCCSWRTRPASGSLPRPAESDRFAWWVHPGALGSRTSGCGQILDKKALLPSLPCKLFRLFRLLPYRGCVFSGSAVK